jgi:hypothetical protein
MRLPHNLPRFFDDRPAIPDREHVAITAVLHPMCFQGGHTMILHRELSIHNRIDPATASAEKPWKTHLAVPPDRPENHAPLKTTPDYCIATSPFSKAESTGSIPSPS